MNRYYPVMMQLQGKRCLVVGGGAVAERKLLGLLDAGANDVLLVSPAVTAHIDRIAELGRIRLERRAYESSDMQGAWIVFAATDNKDANAAIGADAERCGILVNIASDSELGTFITPSVVRRGDLLIAVTASGASPALAQRIKHQLEHQYGDQYVRIAERLRRLRELVYELEMEEQERRSLLRLAAEEAVELSGASEAAAAVDEAVDKQKEAEQWLNSLMERMKGRQT